MPRTARTSAHLSRRLPALAAAGALGLAALTGCASVEEKSVEAAIKKSDSSIKDVDIDKDGTFSIDSEDGSISGGKGTKLPEDFPDDVPLPEGDATIATAITQNDEIAVMYTAKDADIDAEKGRLVSGFEASGYEVGDQSSMNVEGLQSFSIEAVGHGRRVTVTFMKSDGEDAQYMYSVKPEA